MPGEPVRVAIVGGGISGLAAAHRLCEIARESGGRQLAVTLFEESARVGGPLRTVREGDLLLEAGPDQLVTHKSAGLDLCERLGLGNELIEIRGERFAPRVLLDGRPQPLPDGFAMMAPTRIAPFLRSSLFSWRAKARIALEPLVRRRRAERDESLTEFVTRRFGRELLDRVAEPILAGIFTADADRMSMEMTLPRFLALERRYGSVIRGLRRVRRAAVPDPRPHRAGLVAPCGGFGTLVERLVERLTGVEIRCNAGVERVRHDRGRGRWVLTVDGGSTVETDRVILACPAFVSARLLAWDAAVAGRLSRLDYAGCATVYLSYARGPGGRVAEGSGYFVPRTAGEPILACSFASNKFPDRAPPGDVLLRVFLGGARHPEVLGLEDRELIALARRHVERVLGVAGPPRFRRCYRYPRSMPQFGVGHAALVEQTKRRLAQHPGLFLCGGAAGATGLPDCIASGEAAARAALDLRAARPDSATVAAGRA